MKDNKERGQLAYLRKFATSPEEAEIVKEMLADGLPIENILEALGYPDEDVRTVQPDEHSFSNKVPTDEEERVTQQAQGEEAPQPGKPGEPGSEDAGGVEGGDQKDALGHVVGLLNHLVGKKKPK